jgi:hypothetical protein
MKLYIFLITCLSLAASSVHAGSQKLPTVGAAPTAASKGITASSNDGNSGSTNKGASVSTSTGFGNPTASSFGNSMNSTSGNGVVRAPAAALTVVSGSTGGGAAAAVGVGNVSNGAMTGVH